MAYNLLNLMASDEWGYYTTQYPILYKGGMLAEWQQDYLVGLVSEQKELLEDGGLEESDLDYEEIESIMIRQLLEWGYEPLQFQLIHELNMETEEIH